MKKICFLASFAAMICFASCASDTQLIGKIDAAKSVLEEVGDLAGATEGEVSSMVNNVNAISAAGITDPAFTEILPVAEAMSDKFRATFAVLMETKSKIENLYQSVKAGSISKEAANLEFASMEGVIQTLKGTFEGVSRKTKEINEKIAPFVSNLPATQPGAGVVAQPTQEAPATNDSKASPGLTPPPAGATRGSVRNAAPDAQGKPQAPAPSNVKKDQNVPNSQTLTGSQQVKKQ
jgi:hypothetical protein